VGAMVRVKGLANAARYNHLKGVIRAREGNIDTYLHMSDHIITHACFVIRTHVWCDMLFVHINRVFIALHVIYI